MKVKIDKITNWSDAYKEALVTINKVPKKKKIPSDNWIRQLLLAEHSPIRTVEYRIEWEGIKYWTAMELRTHQIGVWHPDDLVFISTQRDDREKLKGPRDEIPQGAPVRMVVRLNSQSIINVSRKRLCAVAHKEATDAWTMALSELEKIDPILVSVCVRECIYRGFCPELKSCGYVNTSAFTNNLIKYRGKNE